MNQRGVTPILILIGAVGILAFLFVASNAPLREGLLNALYPKPASFAANPWDGVLDLPVDYNLSTEQWWANNPFNPDSVNFNTEINSPNPRIDVQAAHGGNIVAAYNALPDSGGTLYLKPGNYDFGSLMIATKDNVHFIGETGAIVHGMIRVVCGTGPSASSWAVDTSTGSAYHNFNLAVQQNSNGARDCFTSRASNYYFKNIIFDGRGQDEQFIYMSAAKNVLFDGITVRNYVTPCDTNPGCFPHGGNIECNAGCTNLWIINSQFLGREQFAVYFDGCHNCGIVNSTFNDNYRQGIGVFLTNDDFSYDLNNNGTFDPIETRNANYIAFYKNNIDSVHTVVANSGKSMMFAGNTIGSAVIPYRNTARCSQKYLSLPVYPIYNNTDDVVRDNVLSTGTSGNDGFMRIEETSHNVGCGDRSGIVGKYIVVNNTINSAPGGYQFIEHEGNVEGPNVICGNKVNGSLNSQNTSTNCPTPPPGSSPSPTTSPTSAPTSSPTPPPGGSVRFVSDLNPTLTGNIKLNKNFNNNPLKLNGQTYEKGVGALVFGDEPKLTVNNPSCANFTALVGHDDESQGTNIGFKVEGQGGNQLSDNVVAKGSAPQTISVNISGLSSVSLVTRGNGLGDWADAKLTGCPNTGSPTPSPSSKTGDLNNDGKVDIFDYNALLTDFGKTGQNLPADIDKNGKVDIFDYNTLITNWG